MARVALQCILSYYSINLAENQLFSCFVTIFNLMWLPKFVSVMGILFQGRVMTDPQFKNHWQEFMSVLDYFIIFIIWVIFTIMCQNCIFDVPRHFTATFLVLVSNIAFVLILSPLPIKYMHIVILILQ